MAIHGCAKCVLVFFNIWFTIIGFILLGAGVFVKVGWDTIYGFIGPILDEALKSLPSSASNVVSTGTNITSSATTSAKDMLDSLGLTAIIEGASTSLIIIGLFLFLVGFLGCCGACCNQKVMLAIYAIIVGLFFLAELVCVILFFAMRPEWEATVKSGVNKAITEQYGGIKAFDGPSLGLNFAMIQYKCCGVDNYTEFYSAQKWQRNVTINVSGTNVTAVQVAPIACCKFSGSFPTGTPVDTNCSISATDVNSNYKTGCYNVIANQVGTYITYVAGALAGIGLIEIIMFAFAVVLICKNNKVDAQ